MAKKIINKTKGIIKKILLGIAKLEPDIPKIRGVHNRILKPIFLRLFGDFEEIVEIFGFKMKLRPKECVDGNLYFAPHLYDRKEIKIIEKIFPHKGVLIDVGAHKGFWSLYFASRFPESLIVAIEANPYIFKALKENVKLNNFKNVILINTAVSDQESFSKFFIPHGNNLGGGRLICSEDENKIFNREFIEVKTSRLSDLVKSLGLKEITAIKLDIEGYEFLVLEEFFNNCAIRPLSICVEYIHTPKVIDLLLKKGYKLICQTYYNAVFMDSLAKNSFKWKKFLW